MQIIKVIGISGLPEIRPDIDLAETIFDALQQSSITLQNNDIIVIAHTIVSKADGRMVKGKEVEVSAKATELANRHNHDPIQVELALREAKKIIRTGRVLITETKNGLVCNFSGVDHSNAPEGYYLLLPKNPDRSAANILQGSVGKVCWLIHECSARVGEHVLRPNEVGVKSHVDISYVGDPGVIVQIGIGVPGAVVDADTAESFRQSLIERQKKLPVLFG